MSVHAGVSCVLGCKVTDVLLSETLLELTLFLEQTLFLILLTLNGFLKKSTNPAVSYKMGLITELRGINTIEKREYQGVAFTTSV